MRLGILILAWITPAFIAELLGWKGIWGAGSAFFDLLIPTPVAGGVFHLASFTAALALIFGEKRFPEALGKTVTLIAASVFIGMVALHIDSERLNAFLFTDYKPHGSPLRFDSNIFYLCITTDALWVLVYYLIMGNIPQGKSWAIPCMVPICIIGLSVATYKFGGPVFKIGIGFPGKHRGQEVGMIYMSGPYDKAALLKWFNSKPYLYRPWENINYEHSAVYFTTSMQAIKWGRPDLVDAHNTLATICLYEEDQSMTLHKGYVDCFSGKDTIEETLKKITADNPTGFGKDLDFWYARVLLCQGVDVPPDYNRDIKLFGICSGVKQTFEKDRQIFASRYGTSSEAMLFFDTIAKQHHLK